MANIIDDIANEIIDSSKDLQSQTITYITKAFTDVFEANIPGTIFINTGLPFVDGLGTIPKAEDFDLTTDLREAFNGEYDDLITQLQTLIPNQFNSFLTAHFPNGQTSWNNLQTYLTDSLNNGTIGLPASVEQQIWDQARERDIFDGKRAEKTALRSSTKRGSSYLQPSVNFAILQSKNDAIRNLSGTNRQIAVDSAKLRIDFIKTTISSIIDIQKTALDATMNYLQQILSSYNLADAKARDYVNSYSTLYQALDTYYGAIAKLAGVKVQGYSVFENNKNSYYKTNLDYTSQVFDRNAKIALTAAQTVGSQASSAFSGLNVLAGYGNIVNS